MKTDIRALSSQELRDIIVGIKQPAFRAKQISQWLWQKAAHSFDDMTNLPKSLRQYLHDNFAINHVRIAHQQHSNDGTIKLGFQLHDNHIVEGVLIPADGRMTACVSSQVGCSLACKFCATGFLPRKRNLNADEIFDQVVFINQLALKHFQLPLTNIVYMGMGEPMLNYKNVVQSTHYICSPEGLHMSPKRITVSTAGIAKMIKKLADDETRFNLALSLHAANDEKRNQIMAINNSNSLVVLKEALQYYYQKLKRKVTYEYIVFQNFNDSIADAQELAQFCKVIPCKVNLIEYNNVLGVTLTNTSEDKLDRFQRYLEAKGITVTVRRSRGKDIDAACGQLANKNA